MPLIASGMLQLLFNTTDTVVVGRFVSNEALAAVGSTGSLINLIIGLFMGLSVGSSVTVAQDLGAGNYSRVRKGVHTAITISLLSGVVLMIFGAIASRTLLELMGSPEDVIDLSTVYLRIYFFGMPASMLYNFGSAILRAKGDTKRPFYALTLAGIANVILDLFFVLVIGNGVAGVAIATIISQYISAVVIVMFLLKEHGALRLNLRRLGVDVQILKQILKIGLPAGFQSVVFSLSNVIIQSTINSFGSVAMSGNAAAANIEGFIYNAMNSFYQTAINFTAQNYGAGKTKRVDKTAIYCIGYVVLCGLVMGNVAYTFREPLLGIYAPGQQDVIEMGMIRMNIISHTYFLCGMMDVMVGLLRGLGNSLLPMIVSLIGSCGLRFLWVFVIFPMNPTINNLYISYPISWALTGLVHIITFLIVRKKAYAKVNKEECST